MEEVKKAFAAATNLFESKMGESVNRCENIKMDSNEIIHSTSSKMDSIELNNQEQIDNLVELGDQQTSYISQVQYSIIHLYLPLYSVGIKQQKYSHFQSRFPDQAVRFY